MATANRRRPAVDVSSTTTEQAPQGDFADKYVHTPKAVLTLDRRPVRTVRVDAGRVGEALYEEVPKITVGEIVFVVASIVSGKPVHVKRAADVVFGWACGAGSAVYEKLVKSSPPK